MASVTTTCWEDDGTDPNVISPAATGVFVGAAGSLFVTPYAQLRYSTRGAILRTAGCGQPVTGSAGALGAVHDIVELPSGVAWLSTDALADGVWFDDGGGLEKLTGIGLPKVAGLDSVGSRLFWIERYQLNETFVCEAGWNGPCGFGPGWYVRLISRAMDADAGGEVDVLYEANGPTPPLLYWAQSLRVDEAWVYVGTSSDGLYRVPIGGGTPDQISTVSPVSFLELAGDSIVLGTPERVAVVSKLGGPVTDLSLDGLHYQAAAPLAVRGDEVYFVAADMRRVERVNLAGAAPAETVATTGEGRLSSIAVDGNFVYVGIQSYPVRVIACAR
jgi:hypothetical protein